MHRYLVFFLNVCVKGLPVYVYLYHEKGIQSPGTVVTDSCELPRGYWELNPDSL